MTEGAHPENASKAKASKGTKKRKSLKLEAPPARDPSATAGNKQLQPAAREDEKRTQRPGTEPRGEGKHSKRSAEAGSSPGPLVPTTIREVLLSEISDQDTTYQFRFKVKIGTLLESMRRSGQCEPIELKGAAPFVIIDGFQRVKTAKRLGHTTIRAVVFESITHSQAVQRAFLRNAVRSNLSRMEQANAIQWALHQGETMTGIARIFGISERQVERYLKLLDLPEHIQAILDGKVVTMKHAKLLADFGIKNGEKWRKEIADGELGAEALRRKLVKAKGKNRGGRPRKLVSTDGGSLRVYEFRVDASAPVDERKSALRALEEAIRWLRSLRAGN